MSSSEAPILAVRGLTKHFPVARSQARVHACEDVSFELKRGETLGIVGESGSGKTTVGRCVLRLLEPTSGEVFFEGRALHALSRRELRRLRRDLRIVYQDALDSLNPLWPVGRQIAEPLRIHTTLSKTARRARVAELLHLVGLPEQVADALPRSLSGGGQQRCSIARALAAEPRVIVLDEPTSSLPPEAQADISRLLLDLQARLGVAYIFISHDLTLVRSLCDHVAVMYLGQIVELARRDRLFAAPQHPYTRALLASVLTPNPAQRLHRRPALLQGEIPSAIDPPKGCYFASRCPFVRPRCREEPQRLAALPGKHLARCWRVAEGELTHEGGAPFQSA